jgi:hypothetical protein
MLTMRFLWNIVLGLSVVAITAGCDRPQGAQDLPGFKARVAEEPFVIGLPRHYEKPEVYEKFAESHGVYLVSTEQMLTALAAECTNDRCEKIAVRYDDVSGVFKCPRCGTTYTSFGLPQRRTIPPTDRTSNERAKAMTTYSDRALERCQISNIGPLYAPQTELSVDPRKRYQQEDQEWSKPMSMYVWPVGEQ